MNKEITTDEICRARDQRIEKLKRYFENNPGGIILFTLNTPGSIKDSPLYRKIFNAGIRALKSVFEAENVSHRMDKISFPDAGTGPEAYISIRDSDLSKIKKITSRIEETHPLGRVFDIDLFDLNLEQIKSGREMRKCFICERPAFECARSRRHPLEKIIDHIKSGAEEYFDSLCWKTASTAARAMISEVLVTPKPGLVDRNNSGAHSDMDIFTFTDSTASLVKTFYDMAVLSSGFDAQFTDADADAKTGNNSVSDLSPILTPLRNIGLAGEKEMFRITKGVNTQKGLIFSIGILSGASGYLSANSREKITALLICETGKRIVSGITEKDFNKKTNEKTAGSTTGEKLYRKHGIKGARGEAEGGFKSSLKALAILKSHISEGRDFNLSLADTLIHIISETEDTNIPGRNSLETLSYAEDKCRTYLDGGGVFADNGLEKLKQLDSEFIEKNISPGGSADILATTLFLYFMEQEFSEV